MSRYKGKIESAILSGEGTFTIEEDGLSCSMLFDDIAIPYENMDAFRFENYSVHVSAKGRNYRFFHMGQQNEWMYNELYTAYNKKVLSALLVSESPILETEGICAYEGIKQFAKIKLFPDSLCILPEGEKARRYPFAFINGLKREAYAIDISLSTGEKCIFTMLGQDFEALERDITKKVLETREENRKFISEICPELSYSDTASAARLLREGIASPLSSLCEVLKNSLVRKAKNSKMAAYYSKLLELGKRSKLALGLKALDEETIEELKVALLEKLNANSDKEITLTAEQEDSLKWIVIAIIPSADSRFAIVEFAFPNEDAATYVFRISGDFESFLHLVNRALEASGLSRELFSAPAEKLSVNMHMLLQRTPAIQELRRGFVGKAVHRNPDSWAKSMAMLTAGEAQAAHTIHIVKESAPRLNFCPQCGAKAANGARFCGYCGNKLQ